MTERVASATSRLRRQALISELIASHQIASQAELADLLAGQGVAVSQGTLSKDLLEIGAVRVRNAHGALIYQRPDELPESPTTETRLAKIAAEMMTSAKASGNLVVVKTPPGAAQYFASAVDRANNSAILGTIAGDDTVLLIAAEVAGGQQIVDWLAGLGAARRTQ